MLLKPTDTLLKNTTDKHNMTSTPSIQWSDIPNDKQDLKEVQSDNSLTTDSPETSLHSASTDSPNTRQILLELDQKIDKLHRELTRVNWLRTRNNFSQGHAVFKTQPNLRQPQTRTCFRCHNRGHLQKNCTSILNAHGSHNSPPHNGINK